MMDDFWSFIPLIFASLLLLIKIAKHGMRDPISAIGAFYYLFAFGPVLNSAFGYNIYFGTVQDRIFEATVIFGIGLSTLIITSLIIPMTPRSSDRVPPGQSSDFPLLSLMELVLIAYGIGASALIVIMAGGASKIDKIALISTRIHYSYLMIQIYVTAFYFQVKGSKSAKKLYFLNLATYVLYCMVVGERDFIFPFFTIFLHQNLDSVASLKKKLATAATLVALALVGTLIFFLRDPSQASEGILSAVLNQGSLLFVNTNVIQMLDFQIDHFNGYTYFNTLMNMLPSWIYKTDFNTLDWFKDQYAPASDSGYGFGLDAEGYLNFGYFGVFLTFLLIALIQRYVFRRRLEHPFYSYFSVFFTGFVMYCLRNDSLAFVKGNLYGVMFFGLVYYGSKAIRGSKEQELLAAEVVEPLQ